MSVRFEEYDRRLGDALRELEVPDHAPGFHARLQDRLARQRRPARWRRAIAALTTRRGGLAVAAAAGLAAILVLALGLPRSGPAGLGPSVATAAEVKARVTMAMATVQTMSGELLLRSPENGVGPLRMRRWSFALTADGDVRLTSADGREDVAYDAGTAVERSLNPSASFGGGPRFASERTGLAPGPPDFAPSDWILQRELGAVVRALLADADPRVVETTFGDRPAWRLDLTLVPNFIVPDADRLVVTVDRETGIPVRATAFLEGRLRSDMRIARLAVNAALPPDAFALTLPAGLEVFRQDAGFRRMGLEEAAARVGYAPLVPASVPEGYRLAEVAVAREGSPTGAEAANPRSQMVVSLSYRRGLQQFVVTTRLRSPELALDGGERVWADPLAAGEGLPEPKERVAVGTGALAGAQVELVIGPRSIPHLWALGGDLVTTVGGDLTRAELLAVAGSLAPR
jgi:hypothetical protein